MFYLCYNNYSLFYTIWEGKEFVCESADNGNTESDITFQGLLTYKEEKRIYYHIICKMLAIKCYC